MVGTCLGKVQDVIRKTNPNFCRSAKFFLKSGLICTVQRESKTCNLNATKKTYKITYSHSEKYTNVLKFTVWRPLKKVIYYRIMEFFLL